MGGFQKDTGEVLTASLHPEVCFHLVGSGSCSFFSCCCRGMKTVAPLPTDAGNYPQCRILPLFHLNTKEKGRF